MTRVALVRRCRIPQTPDTVYGHGQLYPYVGRNYKVYICPSEDPYQHAHFHESE